MDKRTKSKSGRVNNGFDSSSELKKSREIIYIPVKALNILPDDEEYPLHVVLLPPNLAPQFQTQPNQQTQALIKPASKTDWSSNIGSSKGELYDEKRPTPEENGYIVYLLGQNKTLLIFLNIVTILFIAFDVIHDWCQYQDILTIDERNDTGWSFESFSDYFSFPSTDTLESVFNNVTDIKIQNLDHDSRHQLYSCLFGISTVFGTSFVVIRLLNIIGETIKDCKLECFRGFQIIHGWTESVISMLIEETIQCIVLIDYIGACNREKLSYVKLIITLGSGFIKNFFRYLSCRQKRHPGLNFDVGLPFGLHPVASHIYCHLCCGPQEPCSIQRQDCSIGIDCPCMCSCGRLEVCGITHADGEKKKQCCSYSCFSCFEDKNYDPMFSKRLLFYFLIQQLIIMSLIIVNLHNNPEMTRTLFGSSYNNFDNPEINKRCW